MKLLKNLLLAVGLVGAVAAVPAEAKLRLAFFDGNNNRVGGFVTNVASDTGLLSFGNVNGWKITLATGNVTNLNPLAMNINGTISRISNTIGGNTLLGFETVSGGLATALSTVAATENQTLKVRLTLVDFAAPLNNGVTLFDSLTFSSRPIFPATAQSQFDPSASAGGIQNLGTINFNGTAGLFLNQNVSFTPTVAGGDSNLPGLINLSFGFDLTYNGIQTSANGDEFAFTNSISSGIPEPGSLALLGLGLVGLSMIRRKRATKV